MDSKTDMTDALKLLKWQLELGVDESVGNIPLDRFSVHSHADEVKIETSISIQQKMPNISSAIIEAESRAKQSKTLEQLKASLANYEFCDLKKGSRNLVFSSGDPDAEVMIIGEAPGREEDIQGVPFVGRAGRLLDKMFRQIGLTRNKDQLNDNLIKTAYICNVIPWRPPHNRDPNKDEIEMMLPFLKRHISLIQPKIIVAMGNISCRALIGQAGITKLRGNWLDFDKTPLMPMCHPAYLLRNNAAKKDAWSDLLKIKKKLESIA
jgi:uracil-DNA glycosylase family 4